MSIEALNGSATGTDNEFLVKVNFKLDSLKYSYHFFGAGDTNYIRYNVIDSTLICLFKENINGNVYYYFDGRNRLFYCPDTIDASPLDLRLFNICQIEAFDEPFDLRWANDSVSVFEVDYNSYGYSTAKFKERDGGLVDLSYHYGYGDIHHVYHTITFKLIEFISGETP